MSLVLRVFKFVYDRLDHNFNVGHHSEQFFLLRCQDIVSPAMLIPRPRSKLEIRLKTLCVWLLVTHVVGLAYDLSQQTDIRLAMDIFCMLSAFSSMIARSLCLRQHLLHIEALEKIAKTPGFRVGTPYADMTRRAVASQNNRYLGTMLVMHWIFAFVYVVHNMLMKNSFVNIITHFPIDLSERAPTLEIVTQLCYCLTGYIWSWYHASTQLIIIILLRFAITEFRVFLHSLATLNDQIYARLLKEPIRDEERILRELLNEHARQHSQLIVIVRHIRILLYNYSLVHFIFYMIIIAACMARTIIIPGSSSLGIIIPIITSVMFFFETFVLCMLTEMLVQQNRKVSIILYGFNWTQYLQHGRSIKQTMMLMIMQANMMTDFSAGGWTTVSAEVFAKTCRMIYTLMMCMGNLAT